MTDLNPFFADLKRPYVFPIIEQKLEDCRKRYPDVQILNFGIGDIALPLAPAIVEAMVRATIEMGQSSSLRGYGPSEGYSFLRSAIAANTYQGLNISQDEIFISDGTNSDVANVQELFPSNCFVGIPDPTYPVYLDTNIIAGREKNIRILPCTNETRFVPTPPSEHCDIVYLCSPNNPTGEALTRDELANWVSWAQEHKAVLILDHAYAAFVTSDNVPKSIYEIPGAHEVAIECKSFSKSAGFTGLRCGYMVMPKTLKGTVAGAPNSIHSLWAKRTGIKSNGVSYPVQRAAEASLSEAGKKQTEEQVALYLRNAQALKKGLEEKGFCCFGGVNSPYIWCAVPNGMKSWDFFDYLLNTCQIISVPGSGFGKLGEGFIRFSAFSTEEKISLALKRIENICVSC